MGFRHEAHERTMESVYRFIAESVARHANADSLLLDIGANTGETTLRYAEGLNPRPWIYDWRDNRTREVMSQTNFFEIDIEHESFGHPDAKFDIVVCNQVFEHLKNIFHPMSEIRRVLRPGGVLIFSVPNLAAAHNRACLALGIQPTTIGVMGSHVRGFTYAEMTRFLSFNGLFEIVETAGLGLNPVLSCRLPGPLKGLSHTPVWVCRKTSRESPDWAAYRAGVETTTRF